MKKYELAKILLDEKINQYSYSLDIEYPNEAFCVRSNGYNWEVYYSERGNKSSLKTFDDEDEACDYFYKWLIETLKSNK